MPSNPRKEVPQALVPAEPGLFPALVCGLTETSSTRAERSLGSAGRSACGTVAVAIILGFGLTGCRQDMHDQPKYLPLRASQFFEDGRASRPLVAGTISRGQLRQDTEFYTGKNGKEDSNSFPFPITKQVMDRGHQRFDIYCSPCHGRIGNGLGMIVRRGFKQPPSYHIDRLRDAPVGHFYDVITNGYGAMWNYAAQIEPRDRWAIVAYIRALQYSQNATVAELSPEARGQLPSPDKPGAVTTPAQQAPGSEGLRNFPQQPSVPQAVPGTKSAEPKGGKTQ